MSLSDLGRTIVVDLETGDPYIDPQGSLQMCESQTLLKQSADIMVNTQKGSDALAHTYGFDLVGIVRGNYGPSLVDGARLAILECFEEGADSMFQTLDQIVIGVVEDYRLPITLTIVPVLGSNFDISAELSV